MSEDIEEGQQGATDQSRVGQGNGGLLRLTLRLFLTPNGTENVTHTESGIPPAVIESRNRKVSFKVLIMRVFADRAASNTVIADEDLNRQRDSTDFISLRLIFENEKKALLAPVKAHDLSKKNNEAYINQIIWASPDGKANAKYKLAEHFSAGMSFMTNLHRQYLHEMSEKDRHGFTEGLIRDMFVAVRALHAGIGPRELLDDEKALLVDTATVATYIHQKEELGQLRDVAADIEDELSLEQWRLNDLKKKHTQELAVVNARIAEIQERRTRHVLGSQGAHSNPPSHETGRVRRTRWDR